MDTTFHPLSSHANNSTDNTHDELLTPPRTYGLPSWHIMLTDIMILYTLRLGIGYHLLPFIDSAKCQSLVFLGRSIVLNIYKSLTFKTRQTYQTKNCHKMCYSCSFYKLKTRSFLLRTKPLKIMPTSHC